MFNFLYKTVLHGRYTTTASPTHKLFSFQNNPANILCLTYMSSHANQHSFTVSYLINSCGLSPESALSASKSVHFETPHKPDSVINFFKNHGFSKSQVICLIKKHPMVLLSDTEKTLLPKLEFFHSKGVSSPDLARMISDYPGILKRSLDKQIIPSFNFLNNLIQSEEKTIVAIKQFMGILTYDLKTLAPPKINILRENGVPEMNIALLLQYQPRVILMGVDTFKEIVEELKNMGFNPLKVKFVAAVIALKGTSKSTREKRVDDYKRWDWYDDEVFKASGKVDV